MNNKSGLFSNTPQEPVASGLATPVSSLVVSKRRLTKWLWFGMAILFVLGDSILVLHFQHRTSKSPAASSAKVQDVQISKAAQPASSFSVGANDRVVINGQLQTTQGIIITPGNEPTNATLGQLYFNQATKQLYYYDGSKFVPFGTINPTGLQALPGFGAGLLLSNGTLRNSGVLSLQGQTGNVTLSGSTGLGINGTTITNTGVLSLQGQTGAVSLQSGNGITINGTTITNSGVLSATAGSNITIVNDGNGNLTISAASGGGGTITGVTAGTGLTGGGNSGNVTLSVDATVTAQGNTFNGVSQLVRLDGAGALPVLSGVNLTNLNATNVSSGTLSDSRLSSNVALLNRDNQSFTGNQQIFKNSVNSSTAFQVQNSSNRAILSVDTTAGSATLGTAALQAGLLGFANSTNSNVISLQSAVASTNQLITLPDETGTICLRNSTNCGFAVTAGSGSYIQNQTGAYQAANFQIQSAFAASPAAIIRGHTSQSTDILQVITGGNGLAMSIDPNGQTTFKPAVNGPLGFVVQNSGATINELVIDTLNNRVGIGVNPTTTFQVAGSGKLSGNLEVDNYSSIGNTAAPSNVQALNVSHTFNSAVNCGFGCYGVFSGVTATNPASPTSLASGYFSASTGAASFTLQNAYGVQIDTGSAGAGSTITNNYGLYVANQTKGTSDYGVYIQGADTYALWADNGEARFDGNVSVGVGAAAGARLDVLANTTGDALHVNNSTSVGNIAVFQDNGSPVLTIADGGNVTATGTLTLQAANSLSLGVASATTGSAKFFNASGSGNIVLQAANPAASAFTLTLPAETGTLCTTAASASCLSAYPGNGANTALSNLTTTAINADLTFASGANRTISVATPGSSGSGNNLTVSAANGFSTGTGGTLTLNAGTAAASGNGGALNINGGSSGVGSGGSVTIQGGAGSSGPANGSVTVGVTTTTSSVNLQAGVGINIGTVGAANTIQIGNTSGAVTQTINIGTNVASSSVNNVTIGSTVGGTVLLQGPITASGTLTLQAANSVALGVASTTTGSAKFFNSSGSGNIILQAANPAASTFTLTLPAETGTICTTAASASCLSAYPGSGANTTLSNLSAGSVAINTDLSFASGSTRNLNIATPGTNTAGSALVIGSANAGSGATGVAGGNLTLQSGNAAGTTGNANGGSVTIQSGTSVNSGTSGAITIQTGGGGVSSGAITIQTGTPGSISAGNITIDTGNNQAGTTVRVGATNSQNILIGHVVGSNVTTLAGGSVYITSDTGGISIGDDTQSNTIQIGNTATVGAITQNINIGTNGSNNSVNNVTVGSIKSTSSVTIRSGSGGVNVGTTVGTGDVAIGRASNTVTIQGGTAIAIGTATTGGAITLGSTSNTSALSIDSGTGSILIANSASARTVSIANVAAAQAVTLGSTNSTSTLTLQAGGGSATALTLTTGLSSGVTGGINITTGAASGGPNSVGSIVIDPGAATSGAAPGVINIGSANASSVAIGHSGMIASSLIAGATTINNGSSASTITLGNTTGTSTSTINIGTNATASSTSNVTIGSTVAGTVALQGPSTITNRTSGSTDTLVVSNSTSTGNIVVFQDNGAAVFTIADGGAITAKNSSDSASAFKVQNTSNVAVFNVNTTSLRVEIADGGDIKFMGAGNTRNALTKDFTCTATEAVNDIVAITGAATVGQTGTANSTRVAGVVVAKPNTTTCTTAFSGVVQVNFGANGNPAGIGDPVVTSATAGTAASTATPTAGSVLGVSLSNKDGSNLVWVLLRGN